VTDPAADGPRESSTIPPGASPPRLPGTLTILRRASWLVRQNRRQTLAPLAVTMLPFVWAAAGAQFVLLNWTFPDSPYNSLTGILEKAPPGLSVTLAGVSWILALFTLVGFAATVVAVRGAMDGRKVSLTQALDPAFTRMGGLLGLGAIAFIVWTLAALLTVTVVGTAVMLFVLLRISLAVHAFILEDLRVFDAIRTSWRLLRGNVFRALVLLLATIPIALVAFFLALLAAVVISSPFAPANPGRQATLALGAAGVSAGGIILVPVVALIAAATTLLYTELKGREHDGPPARN